MWPFRRREKEPPSKSDTGPRITQQEARAKLEAMEQQFGSSAPPCSSPGRTSAAEEPPVPKRRPLY
jgi:hypothetical protein